jgi:hypothetical protein
VAVGIDGIDETVNDGGEFDAVSSGADSVGFGVAHATIQPGETPSERGDEIFVGSAEGHVRSLNYFEQMKGRGVRIISPDDLRGVTPDASAKDPFVIVDAVGVTGLQEAFQGNGGLAFEGAGFDQRGVGVGVGRHDVLIEKAQGVFRGRGGEADQEGIEVFQDLAPEIVDGAVALVGDNEIEGLDGDVVFDGVGRLIEGGKGSGGGFFVA